MPKRLLFIAIPLLVAWLTATFMWKAAPASSQAAPEEEPLPALVPHPEVPVPDGPLPGDILLEGYASADSSPLEDLKKLHNVLGGYFSVVKDVTRHPIGGNADLAACLLGENLNRQPFIRRSHPILNPEGLLVDRWGTPLSIHPEAARELTLRSAGPDQIMFNEDDLILLPTGLTP
ncbi:MAG: hypothetical protein AAGI48_14305 [Verrucomicrobiota bacterium]